MPNDASIQALLKAVRESCSAELWSQAVELCRSNVVFGEHDNGEELRLRVVKPGTPLAPAVTLWPEDEDWFCDCESGGTACVHVAAAVIALRRARSAGQNLPRQSPMGRVRYQFHRTAQGLFFDRTVVVDNETKRLETTLAALASGRVSGPKVVAEQEDLAVELALGNHLRGVFPRTFLIELFGALSSCTDIRLDDCPVTVGAPSDPIHGRLDDCPGGYRLSVEQDPSITEVFANGAVLCTDTLRAVGDTRLTAREIDDLRPGQFIGHEQVAELLTETLPSLRERIPIRILATKLPPMVKDLAPRVAIETRQEADGLSVLPSLVYGDPPIARIDGDRLTHLSGPVPVRKRSAEQWLATKLEADFGLGIGRRTQMRAEDAIGLVAKLNGRSGELSLVGLDHKKFFMAPGLVPNLILGKGTFELSFESMDTSGAGGQSKTADPSLVMRAWQRGESLVPLVDGGYAPLPSDWLHRLGPLVADLLSAKLATDSNEVPTCMLPDLARLCTELDQPIPAELEGLRALLDGFERLPEPIVPTDLRADLRDYQRKGLAWLSFLRRAGLGGLLADDMGLGKTIQAICAIEGRTIVIAPTSVLHNWLDELRRFRPGLTCAAYYGPGRSIDAQAQVLLTTYAILRLDIDSLAQVPWDMAILDEAQAIKNPESQVAQAAYRLKARFRLTLTGTPVENRLDELWSQFHFINRGLLGGRNDFQERYAKPIADGVPGSAARLRERIRPFLLRRLKRDVAPELPPRTETVLRCVLSNREQALYDAIRATTLPEVIERLQQGGGNVIAALEALLRLRQACCHPALVPGQDAPSSSKVDLLLETLEETLAEGHKCLVFSQWTSLLDLVEPHLHASSVAFIRLDGSTRDRGEVVRAFQDENGPPVMLLSLKAGGTGLNLTSADHVFLLDPWWNPAVEDQAADRTHRIGQDKPVVVHRLVAENTVEERILMLQEQKRGIADAALGEGDRAVSLTRDDLLELLS